MLRSRFALGLAPVLAGLLVAATPAAAQPAEGGVVKKEGEYGGVTPGQAPAAEKPAKPHRPPAKKSLNWVGFTAKEGGSSELFFQAVDEFTVAQRMEGSTLVITLAGLSKQARNTRRPLDARFFDTAVARVSTKIARRKKGIEVRVSFKDAKDAREGSVRTDKGADGMFYAYVTFAPPATPGQIPDAVDRPRATTSSAVDPE